MTEFLSALLGAFVGAFMVFVAELWKQVLAGKAAARFIYAESHNNSLMCDAAAEQGQLTGSLYDAAWQALGVKVAPLLTVEASQLTMITYLALPFTRRGTTPIEFKSHSEDFRTVAYWMHCIDQKGRLHLLLELLKDQPTLPRASDVKRAVAAIG